MGGGFNPQPPPPLPFPAYAPETIACRHDVLVPGEEQLFMLLFFKGCIDTQNWANLVLVQILSNHEWKFETNAHILEM